jgi:hypothetical protein
MGFLRKLWQGVVALAVGEEGQVPSSLTDSYDALLTTTLRNYQPKMRDNITRGNKLVSWLKSKGRTRKVDGGERVQVPLMHAQNNTADIYSGYGLLDTTPTDGITSAFYDWAQLSVSITIARKEKRQNSGKHKALDLLEAKTMQSEASLKELLNNCLVAGRITSGVTGASGQFSARAGRLDSGAAGPLPLAVLIDVDNDRNVAVGNINPSTYAFWRNQAKSSTATTFAGLKLEMNGLYNDCSKGIGGNVDLIIMDQVAWETYWGSLQTNERYIIDSKETIDILGGSDALKFRGAASIWDEVVPDPETNAEVVSAVGTVSASTMYYINSDAWDYIVDSQTDMITTPFLRPENQDASVAQILHMCCTGVNNRRKNGVLYGISRTITA